MTSSMFIMSCKDVTQKKTISVHVILKNNVILSVRKHSCVG